jgi:ABC-type branched-subunit amino acid transport system substrate-binding protein
MADASPFLTTAYRYLVAQKIPAVTGGYDGGEYADVGNEYLLPMLVGNMGQNFPAVNTILPNFLKAQGVTKAVGLGYSISASSTAAAQRFVQGMATVGIPGVVNTSLQFGGGNVQPVILDLKRQGVDGAYGALDNNTLFLLANAAAQNGLNFKAFVFATGYDQGLLNNPTTTAAAENGHVFFASQFTPYEAANAGVKRMQDVFQKYLNLSPDNHPIFGYWIGYGMAQLLIDGLMKAGQNPTRQSFVDAVRSFDKWDDDGILCTGLSFTLASYGKFPTADGCSYFLKVQGGKFVLVTKAVGHNVVSGS